VRAAGAGEQRPHRNLPVRAQMLRQPVCLVEAACQPSPAVQRDRYQYIRARTGRLRRPERCKRSLRLKPAPVLVQMNQMVQWPGVAEQAVHGTEGGWVALAATTQVEGHRGGAGQAAAAYR